MRTRPAFLAALVALAPVAARAQAPSVPGVPAPGYAPGYFTQIVGAYTFSGCASGPVAYLPGSGQVTGTPYCVTGLLTVGVRPVIGVPNGAQLYGFLDYAVAGDTRLRTTPYAEVGDRQGVTGVLAGATCPVGCVRETSFSNASGMAGRQSFSDIISSDPAAMFAPQTILVQLGYTQPEPGGFGPFSSVQATFNFTAVPLTAVPEPSTLALSAAGVLLAGRLARRRRT